MSIRVVSNSNNALDLVKAIYTGAPPTITLTGSASIAKFGTKVIDTHSAYSASSGVFTVPAAGAGSYDVDAACAFTGTTIVSGALTLQIFINGTVARSVSSRDDVIALTASKYVSVRGVFDLVAGDTIDIRAASARTGPSFTSTASENYVHIIRRSA